MTWLSILMPTYNYPEGTKRILDRLCALPEGVELLISDDSSDATVTTIVAPFAEASLNYWRNMSTLSPADNWNLLLDRAKGDYVMLLHHDEVPLATDYLQRLRTEIEAANADVLVQSVLLMDASLRPLRPHLPQWLRDWVIQNAPEYLFRRNVIGPTAALVVRRSLYPRFNPALRWLVDVELYVSLRKATSNWRSAPKLWIGSVQGAHQSLTLSLKHEIKEVDAAEREMLRADFPEADRWLGTDRATTLRRVEQVLWSIFRITQTISSRIVPPK